MFPYTLTPTSLNVLYKGRMRTLHKSAKGYDRAVEIIKATGASAYPSPEIDAELEEIFDVRTFLAKVTKGRVQMNADEVRVNGGVVSDYAAKKALELYHGGFPVEPLLAFIDKLHDNPTIDVRADLWEWLEVNKMPLCDDGDFIAFKRVRQDYKSFQSGTFDHTPGTGIPVEMPRGECDHDRNSTCSRGLHFCAYSYLPNYQSHGRTVVLKINPRDVVAIPRYSSIEKGRACKYMVMSEIPNEEAIKPFEIKPIYEPGITLSELDAAIDAVLEDIDQVVFVAPSADDILEDNELPPITTFTIGPVTVEPPLAVCTTTDVSLTPLQGAIEGRHQGLYNAFYWASSPQGADYWHDRATGNAPISEADKVWLTRLYDYHWHFLNANMTPTSWIAAMKED